MGRRKTEEETIEIFLDNIDVDPVTGCHVWQGGRGTNGYGVYQAWGKSMLAHRYAWESLNGPVPEGMVLRHTCDNKACVFALDSLGGFEGHVVLGTQKDNMDDKVVRGRINRNPRPRRRVTPAEREKIARLHSEGATYYRIAQILDRDQATIKKTVLKYKGVTPQTAVA